MRDFQADTTAVWEQRRQLLEQMRGMASGLVDLADAAAAREPAEPDLLEALEPTREAETDSHASTGGEVDSTVPTIEADDAAEDGARRAPTKLPARAFRNKPSKSGAD